MSSQTTISMASIVQNAILAETIVGAPGLLVSIVDSHLPCLLKSVNRSRQPALTVPEIQGGNRNDCGRACQCSRQLQPGVKRVAVECGVGWNLDGEQLEHPR